MTATETQPRVRTGLADPHHDGSELYVLEQPDALGETVSLRLRVPRALEAEEVVLRWVEDGEPRHVLALADETTATDVWYRASFALTNPHARYRWLLWGGAAGYRWVNGAGTWGHDLADADDFVVTVDPGGPDWHPRSVAYEIFPDRFASSGLDVEAPEWAIRREWGTPPTPRGRETARELYGGDLGGIEQRLDHVESLGANLLYLTPFFPAGSAHRYDAVSFDRVDPLLGGDDALRSLLAAAHARGLRVVGDLTLNHTGVGHEWFTRERSFYFWDDELAHGYASWFGVKSLPKLDWSSTELRERMRAAARRWLDEGLDGWRIDVANMTGRYRDADLGQEAAREIRSVLEPEHLLVAEHGHDFRDDLRGGGWHGTMNYAGFLKPVWQWLRADSLPDELRRTFWGLPVGLPRLDGTAAAATMQAFRAGVPWRSLLHSWNLLDSHDTARFRTVSGSRGLHEVGIGLQATLPGVPLVFAGDELGLEGALGEDARRTMPWDRPGDWDTELLRVYRRLLALRRSSDTLALGGCRWAHVGADCLAYVRETREERLLCLASRGPQSPVRIPLALLGAAELVTLYGSEPVLEGGDAVLTADGPSFNVWRMV